MPKHKPKYELTDETIEFNGHTLHRIRALRDFYSLGLEVKVGELGGWVESEDNLSHDHDCWLFDEAKVFEAARVGGDAGAVWQALVSEDAWVGGIARVGGYARVGGHAWVHGHANVGGDATVGGQASVGGRAWVNGRSRVSGDAKLSGKVNVFRNIHITTGHFTTGSFFDQDEVEAYLSDLKTKEQTHVQT